jgi:3'(2'), 5'-bisphosphate nucleotidase
VTAFALSAAEVALAAARAANAIVLGIYGAPFTVQYKGKDDPVTRADHESNALICDRLARAFPGMPIVAEESDPSTYAGFSSADAVWFVDPVDGTREFVNKNGEFAVMIGLAERGRATVGVITAPAWGRAFVGVVGEGAWEVAADGTRTPIHVSSHDALEQASMVVSRSRTPPQLASLASVLGGRQPAVLGSSGLKAVLVATGDHDVFVQPGRAGMRWDACASDALVRAAGGELTAIDGTPIDYADPDITNRHGLLATNGLLHRRVIDAFAGIARAARPPQE